MYSLTLSPRYTPEVMAALPFGALEWSIRDRMRANRPQAPQSVDELDRALIERGSTVNNQPFYREVVITLLKYT